MTFLYVLGLLIIFAGMALCFFGIYVQILRILESYVDKADMSDWRLP